VVLPEVGHIRATGENEKEAARVIYVAATRPTQRLVITAYGNDCFGSRLCMIVNSEN
jgi:superfamily I DNA/RNA helicase